MILISNSELSTHLTENGFIKYPVFPKEVLLSLYDAVMEEMKNDKVNFYYSGQDTNIIRKKYFYKLVLDNLLPYIEKTLTGYTISRIIVIMKGIGEKSSCKLHTDDNSFDESKAFPLNIWTPLVDTNNENGGLHIIPKSHLVAAKKRGFNIPQYYEDFHELLLKRGTDITTNLGESVIYHPGILHYSNENHTSNLRPAIVVGLAPKSEKPLVYFGVKNWLGTKVVTMQISLQEYLLWDEKTVLKDKVIHTESLKNLALDKNAYKEFLKNSDGVFSGKNEVYA